MNFVRRCCSFLKDLVFEKSSHFSLKTLTLNSQDVQYSSMDGFHLEEYFLPCKKWFQSALFSFQSNIVKQLARTQQCSSLMAAKAIYFKAPFLRAVQNQEAILRWWPSLNLP